MTGATGFVGRALVERLERTGRFALVGPTQRVPGASAGIQLFLGSLADVERWKAQLQGVETVVHLAARTGKARPREFDATNRLGTERLLAAAEAAGVRHFLFASTIAVRYPEKRRYPYARSKEAAEALVRNSRLHWCIARPTIVLGAGSAAGQALKKLAGAPIVPVFGSGKVSAQPIDVGDLADALVEVIEGARFNRQVLELGGPDVASFEEMLGFLHEKLRGRQPRFFHVPLGFAMAVTGLLEPLLLPLLPLTAGQLYAFAYDSLAETNAIFERRRGSMKSLETMLGELAAHG